MLDSVLWNVGTKDKQDKCGSCFPGASGTGSFWCVEADTSFLWISSVGNWRAETAGKNSSTR